MTGPRRGVLFGVGGVARQAHLPGFLRGERVSERLRLVATVDAGRDTAGVDGIPHFTDPRRLEELGPLDFIDICTPTASHLDLTLWGLEVGCHVLCEKPVALSSAEVRQISAAAGARVVMPCHQYRYNPAWRQLREWLEAGAIGEWHLAEFYVYRTEADAGAGRAGRPWRGLQSQARGGVFLDHGTHLIYQLLDVAGMPRSVQSWAGRLQHRSYDVEDTAQVLLDFDGRIGVLLLTWAGDRRETRIRFTGSEGSIEWSNGWLRLAGRHGPLEKDFTAELEKTSYYRWFASLFHEFADRVERGDAATSLEDIARVTQVLEAAYGSHANGCRVAL
jgi:predicted dehydrogenase